MSKFRKKPVVIEAYQFNPTIVCPPDSTGKTGEMFMEFPVWYDDDGAHLRIDTLEGQHRANPGDWIITGVKGEKYPCKPDIFAATYEPVME